ncbi:DNA polymerase III subunit delta [Paludibacteraceae bacterium OttesenSCG-928-F17]|nr:DNA polymerase III subunit delta [Paludibacteraceae bacterium OttesenSCG-928-F17]
MAKKEALSADYILDELRNKRFSPVYFLMGEEPYYIDIISDYIQHNVLDETVAGFDQMVLYGKDTNMTAIIDAAKRYPMMAPYQVIIVKEAQLIKDWDSIVYYLQNPSATTILVFCYKYGTPDKRKKWLTELNQKAIVFESAKIRDYEINGWIADYARKKKLNIDPKGIAMIAEFLGTDLSKIANELDKLVILNAGNDKITPELIEKNIGISKDYNIFELQSALINKDVLKSNRIIRYFAENKKANPMVMVLSQLFSFFSNLMLYHYLPDKSQGAVASELRINPYFVKDYQKAAQTFGAWKTMNIISDIRNTDARYKGIDNVSADEGDLMKELVFKILH